MSSSADRKRPLGIAALSSLLVSLGGATLGMVILTMAIDIRFLASRGGYKAQAELLFLAALSFAWAGLGLLLWQGREDGRRACLVSFALMSAAAAWQAVVAFQAVPVAFAAICGASVIYLLSPASHAWCSAAVEQIAGQKQDSLQTVA